MTYKITIEPEEKNYWPFWPFRRRRVVLRLRAGFTMTVDQANAPCYLATGPRLTGNPIKLSGYVSTDRSSATTVVDWGGGTRLKRETKLR